MAGTSPGQWSEWDVGQDPFLADGTYIHRAATNRAYETLHKLTTLGGSRWPASIVASVYARIAAVALAAQFLLAVLLALAGASCGDESEPAGEPGATTTTTAPSLGY